MIDFAEKTRINNEAEVSLINITSKCHDTFEQYGEISKIKDLEVAKVIIKRLLEK